MTLKKMRKSATPVFGAVFFIMLCFSLFAQQKKSNAPEKPIKKHAYIPTVALGTPGFTGGKIKVAEFDSLLKQGINAHDSLGHVLNVVSFDFMYFERMIYEDSVGDLHQMTDVAREFCEGNKITENVAANQAEEEIAGNEKRDWQ